MRHRVEGRKLKRTASHRKALLQSLTTSLLRHKRIRTTEAKAKEASRFAEAIITRAKRAYVGEKGGEPTNIHARRVVARDIHDGDVLHELFSEIAPKVADRPGGYTRVVKLGRRLGDSARMAIIELVDYNMERDESVVRSRSKSAISRAERVARSRAKQESAAKAPAATAAPVVADEPVAHEEETVVEPVAEELAEVEAVSEVPNEGNNEENVADQEGASEEGEQNPE